MSQLSCQKRQGTASLHLRRQVVWNKRSPGVATQEGIFTRVLFDESFYPDINDFMQTLGLVRSVSESTYTAFDGGKRIASGPLNEVTKCAKTCLDQSTRAAPIIFDDATCKVVELDLRGSLDDVLQRLPDLSPRQESAVPAEGSPQEPRGRGRPKLGVVPREVTLLPRHWEWLAEQPGGASVALRKLVEAARHANDPKDRLRKAREMAYRFMHSLAGDFPGFEEATRALFAGDRSKFQGMVECWPPDVRDYANTAADRAFLLKEA